MPCVSRVIFRASGSSWTSSGASITSKMRSAEGSASWIPFHTCVSAFSGRYRLPATNENATSVPSVSFQKSPSTAQMPSTSTAIITPCEKNSTSAREYTRLRITRIARRK